MLVRSMVVYLKVPGIYSPANQHRQCMEHPPMRYFHTETISFAHLYGIIWVFLKMFGPAMVSLIRNMMETHETCRTLFSDKPIWRFPEFGVPRIIQVIRQF